MKNIIEFLNELTNKKNNSQWEFMHLDDVEGHLLNQDVKDALIGVIVEGMIVIHKDSYSQEEWLEDKTTDTLIPLYRNGDDDMKDFSALGIRVTQLAKDLHVLVDDTPLDGSGDDDYDGGEL